MCLIGRLNRHGNPTQRGSVRLSPKLFNWYLQQHPCKSVCEIFTQPCIHWRQGAYGMSNSFWKISPRVPSRSKAFVRKYFTVDPNFLTQRPNPKVPKEINQIIPEYLENFSSICFAGYCRWWCGKCWPHEDFAAVLTIGKITRAPEPTNDTLTRLFLAKLWAALF